MLPPQPKQGRPPGAYCTKCQQFVLETFSVEYETGHAIYDLTGLSVCPHCGHNEFDVIHEKNVPLPKVAPTNG